MHDSIFALIALLMNIFKIIEWPDLGCTTKFYIVRQLNELLEVNRYGRAGASMAL